jgi:hypothetical protein
MKKYSQEQVREAIMRLSMCARKECEICKYKDRPKADLPSDEYKARSTKNMNILCDVCMCNAPVSQPKPKRCNAPRETLCWECAKNGGLCSWSENFTPVEGWEAVPTKIQAIGHANGEEYIDSFRVISCPEFELMERLKK